MSKSNNKKETKEESLERKAFRTKGLKEGEDDVRLYPMTVVFNEKKWSLEKRFSEFAELDSQLDEAFKNDDNTV
eukprot:1579150-Rhodomonas_salina.1